MATILIGEHKYTEQYVIEHCGDLFGTFESASDAFEFAMVTLNDMPWTLRPLNTLQREGTHE